jgi:hypothetical protein
MLTFLGLERIRELGKDASFYMKYYVKQGLITVKN